jgi:hypothetical protein
MRPETKVVLFLVLGFWGHWSYCHDSLVLSFLAIKVVRKSIHNNNINPKSSSCGFPFLNCSQYLHFPKLTGVPSHIFHEVKALFGPSSKAQPILATWLNRFHPKTRYSQDVLETFRLQLAVGVQCSRLYNVMPLSLRQYIEMYDRITRQAEANKYRGLKNFCLEVFCFHHGLRLLDPRIRASLKKKSCIDIGAFNGDSALVLSEYAKDIYSLELSKVNFAIMNRMLSQNPSLSATVHGFHISMSDQEGESSVIGSDPGARI